MRALTFRAENTHQDPLCGLRFIIPERYFDGPVSYMSGVPRSPTAAGP
jgi:hypothetical protein